MPVILLIVCAILLIQTSPPLEPVPLDYEASGFRFRLVDALRPFMWWNMPDDGDEQSNYVAGDVLIDVISRPPQIATFTPALRRIEANDRYPGPITRRIMEAMTDDDTVRWWLFENYPNTSTAWMFTVRPNIDALTPVELGALIEAEDRSVEYLLLVGNSCPTLIPEDERLGPYNLSLTSIDFVNGTGWAALHTCIYAGFWAGYGPDSGAGTEYYPVTWYGFYGITEDGDLIITVNIPITVIGLPSRTGTSFMSYYDDDEAYIAELDSDSDWMWLDEPGGNLRLTPEGEAAYIDELRDYLSDYMQDPEGQLATALTALDEMFATLSVTIDK